MPLEYGQTDRRLTTSLMDEDVFLLRLRVERLKGSRTYSQKPRVAAIMCCSSRRSICAMRRPTAT